MTHLIVSCALKAGPGAVHIPMPDDREGWSTEWTLLRTDRNIVESSLDQIGILYIWTWVRDMPEPKPEPMRNRSDPEMMVSIPPLEEYDHER